MFENKNDFKNIVSRLNIDNKPNPVHRENLRRQMLSTFGEGQQPKTTWQSIIKSPITKLAAAAVIMLIAVFGIILLHKSTTVASAAERLEEIIETNGEYKGWVHINYELYESSKPMIVPFSTASLHINTVEATTIIVGSETDNERRVQYQSPRSGEYIEYSSLSNEIQIFDLSEAMGAQLIVDYGNLQFPMTVGSELLRFKTLVGREPYEIKASVDDEYERFDIIFFKDKQEAIRASEEFSAVFPASVTLWVNADTKLIHKIRSDMQDQSLLLLITYGEPIINDIYDLGVPREAKVIDNRITTGLDDVLDRLDNRVKGFGNYTAIMTETPLKGDGTPDLEFCALTLLAESDEAWLSCRYLVGADTYPSQKPRASVMDTLETWPLLKADNVLEQLRYGLPSEFVVCDGEDFWSNTIVVKPGQKGFNKDRFKFQSGVPRKIWFGREELYSHGPKTKVQLLKKEKGANEIGVHIEYPTFMPNQHHEEDYWFAPSRDDMPTERVIRDYGGDGKTIETEFHTRYLDYSQLPDGRWYPSYWQTITKMYFETGRSRTLTSEHHLYIYLDVELDDDWFANPFDRIEK